MFKVQITLLVIGLVVFGSYIATTAKDKLYPVCSDGNEKVFIQRDLKFNKQVVAESKFLGNAVYETMLIMQGKQLPVRFDCRSLESNISLDSKNYIAVDPNSCAGVIHKTVCGF